MNWLKDRLIVLFIIVAIVALAFMPQFIVPGTFLLILIVTFMISGSDAGYNRSVSTSKRFSAGKSVTIESLYEAFEKVNIGPFSGARMARIKLVKGPVLLFEREDCSDYFYIYKNLTGRKIYISKGVIKSFIEDYKGDTSKDADAVIDACIDAYAEMNENIEDLPSEHIVKMIYYACRNLVENGKIKFEPTDSILKEDDDQPPVFISFPAEVVHRSYANLVDKHLNGVWFLILGIWLLLILFAGGLINFKSETLYTIFSLVWLFVLAPLAFGVFIYGIYKTIVNLIDIAKEKRKKK